MIKKDAMRALEFDKVLAAIAASAHSAPTVESVMGLAPLESADEISGRAAVVSEIRRLMQDGVALGFHRFEDVTAALELARPEGAVLEPREMLRLVPVLEIMESITSLLETREDTPALKAFAAGLTGFPALLMRIEKTLDGEGNVLDSASFELADIRARRRALERKITKRLEAMVGEGNVEPFLQDEFITKRSGRWVIPVRMDAKGQVQGVVHDVSRSGETAFIEPLEIIGLSNELENLVADERAEEIRVLKALTSIVRSEAEGLALQYGTVVRLDVLQSIAAFAEWHGLEAPEINTGSMIRLEGARHPLLALAKGGPGVVPLDVSLGGDDKVMLITGPNAGGKTVVLKTVGLLSLMALSGIPVPARSTSTFPVLGGLHVDIGDEQSVEANLSTFSAHVSNISRILGEAGPASLALIDELGTGTDPVEGAAIGSAVLRDLKERGATALATTHLVDIVAFVHREAGMGNASMEFDQATHAPLYRLRRGEPGRSHALDIARRYGLPESTLEYARSLMGASGALLEELFAELREKRAEHERASALLESERGKVSGLERRLEERLVGLKVEREQALEAAHKEALGIITDARRKAYEAIEEAKKSRRAAVRKLEEAAREAEAKLRKEPALPVDEIKEGDIVFVGTIGCDVEVISVDVKAGRVKVRAGDKELEVDAYSISRSKGKPPAARKKRAPEREEAAAPLSINLIGKRVDAALDELEPFLNRSSMAGAAEVMVIHGIGTGALMRAVREHLTGHPLVESFRPGGRGEGGEGVTVVRMR